MIFVDTHCHLYDEAFDGDRLEAIQRALQAGVGTMLLPDIDRSSTPALDRLVSECPGHFFPMAGLHPTSVDDDYEAGLEHVRARLLSPPQGVKFVAVGEIGMDLYWDTTFREQQRDALRRQLLWAIEAGLPVCLHIRKAMNEVFGLLRDVGRPSYSGVMHCFGGSLQEAARAVEMGFMLGIGGVVTFKGSTMAEVAKSMPLESLLLETDAPYLTPAPHRGKRNESSYIPVIAQRVADLRGISLQQVAEVTTANARRLFRLGE